MEDVKEYLYVLDFASGSIFELPLDESDEDIEVEDILKKRGLKESQCSYMFSTVKIDEIIELQNEHISD